MPWTHEYPKDEESLHVLDDFGERARNCQCGPNINLDYQTIEHRPMKGKQKGKNKMNFDNELRETIKYHVEGYGGKINPKDDFIGFIFDIKSLITKYSPKEKELNYCEGCAGENAGFNSYRTDLFAELGIHYPYQMKTERGGDDLSRGLR